MKLRLLIGTLMFSAITANAQVATLNETFNNFTAGNTTFPQNGWSAVLPSGGTPPAMMIVFNDTATSNQYIQSYSGSNVSTAQYLVSPQIVSPTGNKSISFKARKNSASAPVMVQVGLASSPTDMTTFVGIGNPTMLTTDTFQTITVSVPSSSSSYLVFRTISGVAAPHTAVDIDDVKYDFTTTLAVSDAAKSKAEVQFVVNSDNTALQFITKKDPKNIQIYSAGAQKVAEGKLSDRSFDISALQTGVYYIVIETAEGSVVQSKFIKK
ncbi:T9SS type A sorting domain-containing protein [Chryseobacterium sp. MMS23-Vi53]|uniref:T9SS type A sorting domain-containing protein n=1 Tax=Chryseobacterium sp. MMS23-Vi53 TaxID=3386644 RepID=UPI0039EAD087